MLSAPVLNGSQAFFLDADTTVYAVDLEGGSVIWERDLMPDYEEKGCPVEATVRGDEFYYLTETSAIHVPFVPEPMHNTGSLIISLSR